MQGSSAKDTMTDQDYAGAKQYLILPVTVRRGIITLLPQFTERKLRLRKINSSKVKQPEGGTG